MSINTVNADTSAVWKFYRHPTPPPEPRDYSQFEAGTVGSDASGIGNAAPSTKAASAANSKVGTDFHTLLLDLQANGTAPASTADATPSTLATPSSAASSPDASAAGPSTTAASTTGTGSVVSDLQTLFNDLQVTSGQGANGVASPHHHHHGPPPATAQDAPNPTGEATPNATANVADSASQDGASGLLGAFVKALQSYGASATGGQASSGLTLSA